MARVTVPLPLPLAPFVTVIQRRVVSWSRCARSRGNRHASRRTERGHAVERCRAHLIRAPAGLVHVKVWPPMVIVPIAPDRSWRQRCIARCHCRHRWRPR